MADPTTAPEDDIETESADTHAAEGRDSSAELEHDHDDEDASDEDEEHDEDA